MNAGDTTLLWTRPLGAWLLLVPLAVFVLAWAAPELARLPTGALGLWRRAARTNHGGSARRGIDPRWLALVAATLLGALAFCGPVLRGPSGSRAWTMVVDRSPSMYLTTPDGGTRLEAAVDAALEALEDERAPGDEVVWRSGGETRTGPGFPGDWREPPRGFGEAPSFELWDHSGCVWITDARPGTDPSSAGVFASGGGLAPGPIAYRGGTRTLWDGGTTSEQTGHERPRLALVGHVPDSADWNPLHRMVRAWARARGFDLGEGSSNGDQLVVRTAAPTGASPRELRVGRDGWSATVRVPPAGEASVHGRGAPGSELGLETWLAAAAPGGGPAIPLVSTGPGRVEVRWFEMSEPEGDPAAFAVSWGRLLDSAALAPEGVVPVRERLEAGESFSRSGRPPSRSGAPGSRDLAPWLAGLAALFAVLACLGRR